MRRHEVDQSLAADLYRSRASRVSRRLVLSRAVSLAAAGATLLPPGGLLARTALAAPSAPETSTIPTPAQAQDWDVPGGHFYTQTVQLDAPADSGFLVSDGSGARMWRDFKEMGGPAQLGFPVSSRYDVGGITYQATQAAVLRWNESLQGTDIFPIFTALSDLKLDDWLESRGIPRPSEELLEDPTLPVETRLSWLTNPLLRQAYLGPNQTIAMARFGLPMGEPERFGPYLAQRFDKTVLQLWLDNVPGQSAGTVTMVQVGQLLTEADLIPETALVPQQPPAPRPVPQTLPGSGQAPSLVLDVPGFGKYIVVSLSRQWWFAYQDGQQLFGGPVTTGQPALVTPLGSFTILSRHSPYTMVSPWGPESPFWYPPSNMTYALRITDNGVFLHDAPWRPFYGPGTNFPHYDPDGEWRTGSHGCINLPFGAASWLWSFAPVGTPVQVVG